MTPRNQMYSVLTPLWTLMTVPWPKSFDHMGLHLLRGTSIGFLALWVMTWGCNDSDIKAARANILTYEDGLALANKRLKNKQHPWSLKMSEKDRKQWTKILARAYDDAERTRK